MLVLPIVNRNRILNVKICFKAAKKIKKSVKYNDVQASDIVVNNIIFSQSVYHNEKVAANNIMKFIRNSSVMNKGTFFVSTKEEDDSDLYDVYEIDYPGTKVTEGLDDLFGSVVLDLKNKIPDREKGRYVDFERLGITDHITEEKLEKLAFIANHVDENYHKAIIENGLESMIQTLSFLELFDCVVIEKSSIKLDDFQKVLNILNNIHSKDSKILNNYLNIALANQEAYSKLSKLYNIVYNESFSWIHSHSDKVKVKTPLAKKVVD